MQFEDSQTVDDPLGPFWQYALDEQGFGRTVHGFFQDPAGELKTCHLDAWQGDISSRHGHFFSIPAGGFGPYRPFLDLIGRWFTTLETQVVHKYLSQCVVFPRQVPAFAAALGIPGYGGKNNSQTASLEPVLMDEWHFERTAIRTSLHKLLALICRLSEGPICIFCENAHLLSPETVLILKDQEFWQGIGIITLFVFPSTTSDEPSPHSALTYLRELNAQARVIRLSEGKTTHDFEQQALPTTEELTIARGLHCNLSAIQPLLDHWKELEESGQHLSSLALDCLFNLTWNFEAEKLYDQAIYYGEQLHGHISIQENPTRSMELLLILSRAYRAREEAATASRYAMKAWNIQTEETSEVYKALLDLHLYLYPHTTEPNNLAHFNAQTRLLERSETLGWINVRAFILTRNVRVMDQFWAKDRDGALAGLMEGLALTKKSKNYRRMGVAYQTLGTLEQALGKTHEAIINYKKSQRLFGLWSSGEEQARLCNGLGYYFLSLGMYQASIGEHQKALDHLWGSRYYEQILITLINVSFAYLLAGQPRTAMDLIEKALVAMNMLGMEDMQFHPKKNLHSHLAMCALKSGDLARATLVYASLHPLVSQKPDQPSERQLYFEAMLAFKKGLTDRANQLFQRCIKGFEDRKGELRHLVIQARCDYADFLDQDHRHDAARQERIQALKLCLPLPCNAFERQRLNAALGNPPENHDPQTMEIPALRFDADLLRTRIEQDITLARFERTMRESHFLQKWQDKIHQIKTSTGLVHAFSQLLAETFPVDKITVAMEKPYPPDLASYISLSQGKTWFSLDRGLTKPWSVVSLVFMDLPQGKQGVVFLASTQNRLSLTGDDHRVILLASQQLANAILAMERQHALETSHQELGLALGNLQEAQEQLIQSEKLASLGSMVAGVAHEINTPLGVSLSAISHVKHEVHQLQNLFLNNQLKRSDLERYISHLVESTDIIALNLARADTLVESFKQVGADRSSAVRREFSVKTYLQELVFSLAPRLRESQVSLTINATQDVIMDSYPGTFSQVMTNLIVNSLFHAFEGIVTPTITISIKHEANKVHLEFCDNGVGIEERHMGKIWDPFFTTKRGKGGTGLGLHIVHNLVYQVLGGSISCKSDLGRGTCFYLSLPQIAPSSTQV